VGPLDNDPTSAEPWSVAAGLYQQLWRHLWIAAGWRRPVLARPDQDLVRLGALTPLGRGDISLGIESPVQDPAFERLTLLLGWTAGFNNGP